MLFETCIYCKGEIEYTGLERYVKCKYCGKTFAVTKFQSEQAKMRQAMEEGETAKAALKEAEKAKVQAQERLNMAVEALSGVNASQANAEQKLALLLEQNQADQRTRTAIQELLIRIQSSQEQSQDTLTRLMLAIISNHKEAGDKLSSLAEITDKLLSSQDDLLARSRIQLDILTALQEMKMEAAERQKLQSDFVIWSQSIRAQDIERLKGIQSSTSELLSGQKELSEKICTLKKTAEETQKTLDAFRSEYKADKVRTLERLYHDAQNFQRDRVFDKAANAYRQMLVKGSEDPEIYWRLVLCHYCIEYQKDDEGRWIPTILNPDLSEPDEIMERRDLAENIGSDEGFYQEELRIIDKILERYRRVRHEMNFDVFISVKQTDKGRPTKDSIVGLNLYSYLTSKGLRVFNSAKTTLPAGHEYEPYIIAALMSAKALIVVGTSKEYMDAQWVRNEWQRFQWLQRNEEQRTGKTERVLFCYLSGAMQPNDIPKALNRNKEAIIDNLDAHMKLDKALGFLMPQPKENERAVAPHTDGTMPVAIETVLQQMEIWSYKHQYDKVLSKYEELTDRGLNLDRPEIHLWALCAENHLSSIEQLSEIKDLTKQPLYIKAEQLSRGADDKKLFSLIQASGIVSLLNELDRENAQLARKNAQLAREKAQIILDLEQGDASDQFTLGCMYYQGKHVAENKEQALKWFKLAAERGDARAQLNLGLMYDEGEGVSEDKVQAFKWYKLAAEQGDATAQLKLGLMYDEGEGVSEDKVQAFKWYKLAAEQGDAAAQRKLGSMYYHGRGVVEDKAQAIKWFKLSAEQGDASAQCLLGVIYCESKGIVEDKAQAFKWFKLSAEQGIAIAQYYLGKMYYYGEGIHRDKKEAKKWLLLASQNGDIKAKNLLREKYRFGKLW